jgi:hypothetical protein
MFTCFPCVWVFLCGLVGYNVNQWLLCLLCHKYTFIAYNVSLINNVHHNQICKHANLLLVIETGFLHCLQRLTHAFTIVLAGHNK